MRCSSKLSTLLLPALIIISHINNAAETKTGSELSDTAKIENAGSLTRTDTCDNMEENEFMGSDICADCHDDMPETMLANPHGQADHPRSPAALEGCESCHGPGLLHVENEGGCIISMSGSADESNAICLKCHDGENFQHWPSSTHKAAELACTNCHSVHQADQVLKRITQSKKCHSCHEDVLSRVHIAPVHPVTGNVVTCSDCHDLHGEAGLSVLNGKSQEAVERHNDVCLKCHDSKYFTHWLSSTHEAEGLACANCHSIHRPDENLNRTSQAEACYACHKTIRAQTFRASSHPIRDRKMPCSDCHDPHGAAGPSSLKQYTINENCYYCHAEKRGPFLWEHYPVSEDCTLCHRVHGSNHQALLNRPGPQLCQQCHADISRGQGNHVRRFLDNDTAPGRARFRVVRNCANCHSKIHGSNHPSGAALMR